MKYHCGHFGCDICGARECTGEYLNKLITDCVICSTCIRMAVNFAIRAAETFGGTIIDPSKKCGYTKDK